jgi:hypothetical protein
VLVHQVLYTHRWRVGRRWIPFLARDGKIRMKLHDQRPEGAQKIGRPLRVEIQVVPPVTIDSFIDNGK